MRKRRNKKNLLKIYRALEKHFGDLGWWPASSPFEVIVGAVLTQNTAWTNVEKAIRELKRRGLMTAGAVLAAPPEVLARAIRSAGYHNLKAKRLKNVVLFLRREGGKTLAGFRGVSTRDLRDKLLAVNGIGPETADSILLYAFERPVFVVDAYTKRIFARHGITRENAEYGEIQELVSKNFPKSVKMLNQFHALLVETAKRFCKKNSRDCGNCPLGRV